LGLLLLAICVSGVLAADPVVTITVTKWCIPPLAPTSFTITQTGVGSINITWTMGTAANTTIIRGSTSGYPFTVLDGDAVYSGNGTYVEVSGLDLDSNTYYYRAWSVNEYGTSANYAQAAIGEDAPTPIVDMSEMFALISGFIEGPTGIVNMMFAVSLMGFAFWKRGWLRVMLAIALIIWGAYMTAYDMKIAAPFIGVGTLLFIMAIFRLVENYKAEQQEAQWAT